VHPANEQQLTERAIRAAEAALAKQHYVSSVDVFLGMGLLAPSHIQDWKQRRVDFLERVIQGNLKKISLSMKAFHKWAQAKRLKPSETRYERRTRGGTVDLRFSKSGDWSIERRYRTHYVSPDLSERKRGNLEERLAQSLAPVV